MKIDHASLISFLVVDHFVGIPWSNWAFPMRSGGGISEPSPSTPPRVGRGWGMGPVPLWVFTPSRETGDPSTMEGFVIPQF